MTPLVTLAMAVYGQPLMLDVWFQTLRSYFPDMLAEMELLIVDDCGTPPAVIPDDITQMLKCRLFRVTEQIPWNQPGARNLALEHAKTKLILFVDPDMVFPPAMMERILDAGQTLGQRQVIRFMLRHRVGRSAGQIDASSPNTWFLHVDDFRQIGGYDEDYSGNKGWSDVQLLDVMRACYKIHHRKDLFAEFYSAEEVSDAMVSSLDRSTKANKRLRILKGKEARMVRGWPRWAKRQWESGKRLRFQWERVL